MNEKISAGEVPVAGTVVELCRASGDAGNPTILEWFTANGAWAVPEVVGGHYYRRARSNSERRALGYEAWPGSERSE